MRFSVLWPHLEAINHLQVPVAPPLGEVARAKPAVLCEDAGVALAAPVAAEDCRAADVDLADSRTALRDLCAVISHDAGPERYGKEESCDE